MIGNQNQYFPIHLCVDCGDDVDPKRSALGYKVCLFCGDDRARMERASWCIVQEYNKGAYTLVTTSSAPTTLKQTNPKENRV